MLNQTEGNPIRISVQQGWNDPSVTHDEAAMTQVCPLRLYFIRVSCTVYADPSKVLQLTPKLHQFWPPLLMFAAFL